MGREVVVMINLAFKRVIIVVECFGSNPAQHVMYLPQRYTSKRPEKL